MTDQTIAELAHDVGMDAIDWDMVRDGVGDPEEAASIAVRAALEAAEQERDNWKMSAEEAERAEKRWKDRAVEAERERDRLDEIKRLRQWKAEAMDVLSEWEKTWIAAGRPGRIGTSKAAVVREEIERLRGEGDWEYQGIPIYEDGSEAVGRSIEACREWVERDANPHHWIHEEWNSDLPAVVSYRVERRRKAGPWEPVEGDGDA